MAATIRPKVTPDAQPNIVDTHFQNEAVTVWFTLLPREAASILFMYSSDHVTIRLPYLEE